MSAQGALFPSIGSVAKTTEDKPHQQVEETTDDDDRGVQEIESLCMSYAALIQGVTRMLLTSIPYFREVIVMSFRCEHCGATNNEIQSASTIRPEGVMYTARILSRSDLNRQIVKSETCTVDIPEYQLTIPPSKGQLTTVEGMIRDVVRDLSLDQPLRRVEDEVTYAKIEELIDKLKLILADHDEEEEGTDAVGPVKSRSASSKDAPMPTFTVKLDDPSGNSFIEFIGNMSDPNWNVRTYHRTKEQNIALSLVAPDEVAEPEEPAKTEAEKASEQEQIGGGLEGENEEIYVFPGTCSSCGHPVNTNMKKVVIPYFKDILIMSTNCDRCGYRDNEVKSGSAISKQGKRITLKVEDRDDLSRDVLKSETGGLSVPEIDLLLHAGTLGVALRPSKASSNKYMKSCPRRCSLAAIHARQIMTTPLKLFLQKLKEVKNVERPFTLIIDDPLANSYVQNIYAPDPDPNMEVVMYDRTWEQNEELGLNDMKVEGYEADAQARPEAPSDAAKTAEPVTGS
ncbi:hypothetical protein EW146_g7135 [Bondarzewia mesenterica]|uniref:Zinc finger ZPR1-type domain-containing protein n=1 Tax=Bondarzewia mesenterica TaxID=1095465 RepID=A0A4S4LLS7_9AGAM|nr:hypothetical protein EW146_g7135 [Bondarzewia mesenterica]